MEWDNKVCSEHHIFDGRMNLKSAQTSSSRNDQCLEKIGKRKRKEKSQIRASPSTVGRNTDSHCYKK